jgi:hypothetical protein
MIAVPEKLLPAWITVPDEGLSPWPNRCVLGGKVHPLGMTMVPAGSRMFAGALT